MAQQRLDGFVGQVSRPKLSGGGKHAGVLLPGGLVAHMTQEGAAIVTFTDFAQGRPVTLEKAAPISTHHQVHWRAHQTAGRTPPYHLLNRNCEHYATFVMGEKAESPQVNAFVILGLIGAVIWAAQ
jgi:hypothetical protein